ncbi:hypothetical protein PROFUN_15993 [Planoprotostelium fungivorum]|uniref:Uncharacterized protein n=1 Tax=Planoprotostelium fungivorum TaxID=1890364 RepID=A0A2P6MTD7_9EUKA|nr:hypothetical protein PROFUN_15993 [Planoprotostelium fungivorum]
MLVDTVKPACLCFSGTCNRICLKCTKAEDLKTLWSCLYILLVPFRFLLQICSPSLLTTRFWGSYLYFFACTIEKLVGMIFNTKKIKYVDYSQFQLLTYALAVHNTWLRKKIFWKKNMYFANIMNIN